NSSTYKYGRAAAPYRAPVHFFTSGARAKRGSQECRENLRTGEDVHDVAVFDDVGLAFQAIDAVRLRFLHRADALEIVVADHLGADETARQVRMDLSGADHGVGPFRHAPRPALVFADREKDDLPHRRGDRP